MNGTEEVRLCQKCGKRLPSSNNFCMYCGYNNNLNDAELEALKGINANNIHTQKKQELLNKSINATDRDVVIEKEKHYKIVTPEEQEQITLYKHQHDTIANKLIYVLILLDVILISGILLVKSDGLLYERFNVNLDNYDKVINIDDKSFLGLKNNKIEVIGENKDLSTKDFSKINDENVLGMTEYQPDSSIVLIETSKKIYAMTSDISSYFSTKVDYEFKSKKISKASKNFYKDVNTKFLNSISETGDYYNILMDKSYFIIGDTLYWNVRSKDSYNTNTIKGVSSYSLDGEDEIFTNNKKTDYLSYRSEKVYDGLKMDNPEIVDTTSGGKTVIIKGNNVIKVISDGELIQSIKSITYNNKTYNIDDFKYILYKKGVFTFICKNGAFIKYDHSENNLKLLSDANIYGAKSKEFKLKHGFEFDKNIVLNERGGNDTSIVTYIIKVKKNWKAVAILFAAIAVLIAVMYHFREASFIVSSGIFGGVVFCYLLLLFLYAVSQLKEPQYFEAIKTAFKLIPVDLIIGVMLGEIKEIVSYLTDKLCIETPYHFVLMLIGLISTILAIGLLTNNLYLLVVLPGIVWIFMTDNNETFKTYNFDLTLFLKLFGTLIASVLLTLIMCYVLNICQYYLYILLVSFSISCCLVLNDNLDFMTCFKKFANSNILLFILFGFIMIYGFISMANIDPKYGEEIVKELTEYYLKGTVITSLMRIVLIAVTGLVCAAGLFLLSKVTKPIMDKFNNRIFKIFIYMIVVSILCAIVILSIPVMNLVYTMVSKLILGDKTQLFDIVDLFGSSGML